MTKGFGIKTWDWMVATEDFQRLVNEGLELNGCQQKLGTEGLCYIWILPTERLWLTGQANGNWSFATEGGWDWRLGLNGCDWGLT